MPEPICAPQKDALEEIDLQSGGESLLSKPKRGMGGEGDAEAVRVAGTGKPSAAAPQPLLHFNVGKMYFEFTRMQVYSAGAIFAALLVIIITIIAVSSKSSDGGATSSGCKNCTSETPVDENGERAELTGTKKKWYETGPLAEAPQDSSSWGDVKGKLPQLSTARVRGVFVASALARDTSNNSLADFEVLVAEANKLDIRIIVSVVCGRVQTTHDWFARSESREPEYDNYFVWANNTRGTLPNNWKNGTKSAWSWSDRRNAYYLSRHSADSADLNLREPAVRREVGRWLGTWMRAGAAGVRLPAVRSLLVDKALGDEGGRNGDDEGCSNRTCDQPGLAQLLAEWRAVVKNYSEVALFTVGEDLLSNGTLDKLLLDNGGAALVDIPRGPLVQLEALADEIMLELTALESPPAWPSVMVEVNHLMEESWMVGLMVPAVPIFFWEQIAIMFQNKTDNGRLTVYESVLGMRERMLDADTSAPYRYNVTSIRNVAAVFSRWRDSSDGYVVAVRPQVEEERIDLRSLEPKPFPATLTAALLSSHYDSTTVLLNSIVKSEDLYMVDQCAIILTFNK